MHVVITDFVTGECEFTGKADVECVRVRLDEASPDAVVSTAELIRLLRFKKKQLEKQTPARGAKGPET